MAHATDPTAPALRPAAPATRRHLRSSLAAAGVAISLLLGAAACGSGDDTATTTTGDTEIGDAATLDTSTTVAESTSSSESATGTSLAAPVGAPDPEAAVTILYDAWKADDRVTAATVAEPFAVDGIFEAAEGDYSLYNRCNTGEFGQSSCLYRGSAGTIQFSMVDRGGAWVVTTAIFSAG